MVEISGYKIRIVLSENADGEKEARTVVGNALIIHEALPNATFVGFTGTPISAKDRNTREVFGDYIDVYPPSTGRITPVT